MNKQLRTLLAFSAIGISTAALPASGSESQPLHVSVPFAFIAGKTALPAGEYTIVETDSHTVLIRGDHASAIVLGSAGEEMESDRSALGFTRTEKGVYLRSVRSLGKPVSLLPTGSQTDR